MECPHPGCNKFFYGVRSHHNNTYTHTHKNAKPDDCWICEENEDAKLRGFNG